jgi:UDP-glucose 4-epimerase
MDSNLLLIGGAGFIGSAIVKKMKQQNPESKIYVVEPAGANLSRLNGVDVNIFQHSLIDTTHLVEIIEKHQIDTVVHLVSTLIPGSNYSDYKREYQNVIFPSIELMEECARLGVKFVYFSSGGTIYGNRNDTIPFSENDSVAPISYYGWSKQMMENSVLFMHRTKGLRYLILRPSNPYGHGQNIYGKQGLVAVAIGKIINDEPVEVWGDGSAVRDYIYIDDLASIFSQLIQKGITNTTLNVGSGRGYSVNDVLAFLKIVTKKDFKIVYADPRPVDVSNVVLGIDKLCSLTAVNFTNFIDGIKMFYQETTK